MSDNWTIKDVVDLQHPPKAYRRDDNALMLPGDNLAHTWRVTVLNGGADAVLASSAVAYFLRSDGNTVMIAGTADGNVCSVTLTQECYAVSGMLQAAMRITDSETNATVTVALRLFDVRTPIDDGGTIDPGEIIPSIDELLAQIEAMEEATEDCEAAAEKLTDIEMEIAPTVRYFSPSNANPDIFTFKDVTWEQGAYSVTNGETESTNRIRSEWFPNAKGVVIYNPGSARQYGIYTKDTNGNPGNYDSTPWRSDEIFYIPAVSNIASLRLMERFANGGTIVPADNRISVFDNTWLLATINKSAVMQRDSIVYVDGKKMRSAGIAFERGYFNSTGNSNSAFYIRTGVFADDVYIHNPDRLAFSVLRSNGQYMQFTSAVSGVDYAYDDALVHLPALSSGTYRIRVCDYRDGTYYEITPESSTLALLTADVI